MNLSQFDEIARDVALLKEVSARLNKYMHVNVEITELNMSVPMQKVSSNKGNVNSDKPKNLSEGIRFLLNEKGKANLTEIYDYFDGHGWEMVRKTKNTIRSILSQMKTNGKIVGSGAEGFRLIH